MHLNLNLINGRFITLDGNDDYVNSITIKNGKIKEFNNPNASFKTVDLDNNVIIPGFIDSHFHLKNYGKREDTINLKKINSIDEIVQLIKEKINKNTDINWVEGFGWDHNLWGGKYPNPNVLNSISDKYPIALTRIDGHSMWVNDIAINQTNCSTDELRNISGGNIINNCILIDNSMNPIMQIMPNDNVQDIERWIRVAIENANKMGITNAHDAWQDAHTVQAIKNLIAKDEMNLRCYGMLGASHIDLLNHFFSKGHLISDLYTIRSVKAFIDGALGSRGAALLEPYSDDAHNCGLILIEKDEFEDLAQQCNKNNFQLCTHAIGDKGNRFVLDTYNNTLNDKTSRWRVEHAQMVHENDIEKFLSHQIIPSMQPSHCTSDMPWLEDRVGVHRIERISKWRTFIDQGLKIAGGSDCPIETGNPLFEFYAACTRQDHKGFPKGGWQPQEKIQSMEALKMLTTWGAYAEFNEGRRGKIKLGFDGDLTVLSNDITKCKSEDILNTEIVMTIIQGATVYIK